MTPQVEQFLAGLQGQVPSLAKAPSVLTNGVEYQPPGVFGSHEVSASQSAEDVDTEYVYVAHLGKLVKVVQNMPGSEVAGAEQVRCGSASAGSIVEDTITSEDEDCPIQPEPGFKFIWKKDNKGRKYFISEPIHETLKTNTKYVYDKKTGRTYKQDGPNHTPGLVVGQRKQATGTAKQASRSE